MFFLLFKILDEGGITVFANLLHTHTVGKYMHTFNVAIYVGMYVYRYNAT